MLHSTARYFSQSESTVVIQGVLQPGDVLDEVFGVATRPLRIHQVLQMLRSNKGVPIELGIVKVSTPAAVLCRGSAAHTCTCNLFRRPAWRTAVCTHPCCTCCVSAVATTTSCSGWSTWMRSADDGSSSSRSVRLRTPSSLKTTWSSSTCTATASSEFRSTCESLTVPSFLHVKLVFVSELNTV